MNKPLLSHALIKIEKIIDICSLASRHMSQEFRIQTTQNVDLGYEVASLGDRILAYLLDALIQYAYIIAIVIIMSFLNAASDGLSTSFTVLFIVLALPFIFYHFLFELLNNGQSPGKRSFNMRVVRTDGEMTTMGSLLLRWLFRLVDIQLFSGLVAIIVIAASGKGQRVGDIVAGTTVIKERKAHSIRHLAYEEPKEEYIPTYPQVRKLNSQQIEVIRETLNNLEIDHIHDHVRLLSDKIAGIMGVDFEEHPRKFLRTVVKDFTHYLR